ncbi:MAG: hypothetical protein ACOZF0_10070 [Thermodesulfobacteriota bacterium]
MTRYIYQKTDGWFQWTEELWKSRIRVRFIGKFLILVYLLSLALIEIGRRGFLPSWAADFIPQSHFHAISAAFTFLLYIEMIDLVFGLARSFSDSIGKQFQIFALILLRQSFKEFAGLPEPLGWTNAYEPIWNILGVSLGALMIFAVLVLYYRTSHHQPITRDEVESGGFISAKKVVSLSLLAIFILMGLDYFLVFIGTHTRVHFFDTFYTILVFSDILIVLISLRYSCTFAVVFRNSGFALATVVLRLALSAPPYISALLGVCSALYVLGLTAVYNCFIAVRHGGGEGGRCDM